MSNPDEAIRLAAISALMERARGARESRVDFCEFVWTDRTGRPIKLVDCHKQWLNALDKHPNVFVEAARGHGKSSLISMAMPIYELGRNPNLRIKLLAQSDTKAKERLIEIRRHMLTPAVRAAFPGLEIDKDAEDSKTKITVKRPAKSKDASIEAVGVLSAATGGRADLMIFDDIVDLRNSVVQPSIREQIKQRVLVEWIPLVEGDGRVWVLNTPFTTVDIAAILKASPEFHAISSPVGTADDPFASIWEAAWPRHRLEQKYKMIGPVEYDRAFRCITLSADVVPIQARWIKYYDRDTIGDPDDLFCLTSYDLALSQSTRADYFAGVVLLYNSKKNLIFVVDAWQGRLSLQEQADAIVADAKRWLPSRVVVEKVGLQGYLGQFLAGHAGHPMSLWPWKPRGSKKRRVMEIQPLIQDARILFHPKLNPRVHQDVVHRGDIVTQLIHFPMSGEHDDLVDALTQGVLALREMFPVNPETGEVEEDGITVNVTSF